MSLLHWCTLTPEGPSSLAAIRFAAPIRISSIRVFPNGVQPFVMSPEIVARTEPEAFFLEVFFNAQLIPHADSKEKQRVTNALVPTMIAYAGGQVDFTVDMGIEYATRLMIVKGEFEALSMAIYGNIVSDAPPPREYKPRPLPPLEPTPLSKIVDPSNSSDPTLLAKQLLALVPDAPPLPLVVRLMFCLKPSNDDWDLPEFPYLHADLDVEMEDELDLETAIEPTFRPVRDDVPPEILSRFAARVASCIGPNNGDQAYQIARLLCISASQHPDMARTLLQHLDLSSIFDTQTLDETTVLSLLDAATNVDIARHLNNESFLGMLREVQDSSRVDKPTQLAARRLVTRIRGWQHFEDALSNTRGEFFEASNMLKDIGTEEQSLGIWLESMVIHEDITTKLAEILAVPTPYLHPPFLLRNNTNIVSHDEFISFVRAYIGVASVLAVWAWTDSLGNDPCREQALAILHLWQGVNGYREIVNHLLLLRQLTRRLEWITADNDPPRKSGILAEKVIVELAKDPRAILHDDLVKTILSLKAPLSFIAESERLSMRKVALVAEDGLSAAIEELMFSSDRPLSLRRIRNLRVSLAIVEREVKDVKGEWRTVQASWDEQSHGIVPRLVDLFIGVSDDLSGHFGPASPPPPMKQSIVDQLFQTADELLRLIMHLTVTFPLTSRGMRLLTIAVTEVFVFTDAADMLYSPTSPVGMSAQEARQTCLDLVRCLSSPEFFAEPGRLGAEIVLRTLLGHGGQYGRQDPVYHLLQVFTLVDHILPEPHAFYDEDVSPPWITSIIPKVVNELKSFFRLLTTENKLHLFKRLIALDDGTIGIGEWLLTEEVKHLSDVLNSLENNFKTADHRLVLQHQANLILDFILGLVIPTSNSSSWCLNCLCSSELSQALDMCLTALLDGYYTSPHFQQLVTILATSSVPFDEEIRFTILLCSLRCAQFETPTPAMLTSIVNILKDLSSTSIKYETLRLEIGQTLASFPQRTLDIPTCEALLSILVWLSSQDNTRLTALCGITSPAFTQLCDSMQSTLPEDHLPTLSTLQPKFTIDEDEYFTPSSTELPQTLSLSIQNITDLLRQSAPATPKTPPKGTKTPDILGLVISPPTALLRSPATTGLTKTYTNNDFRELRQTPSARQNTSRLPSMHGFSRGDDDDDGDDGDSG